MPTFTETFKLAERYIRPLLEERGFKLDEVSITDESGSQWVCGAAHYVEKKNWRRPFNRKRFIRLSTAPLRLELDLDIGKGDISYSIYELHELEGNKKFPERAHDLYKAMYDESQLISEFERLIQVLSECGSRFLSNDSSLWSDLNEQRVRHAEERENERVLKDAEMAFKKQDWAKVVSLLEDKHKILSKLDSGRLKYAGKKLDGT